MSHKQLGRDKPLCCLSAAFLLTLVVTVIMSVEVVHSKSIVKSPDDQLKASVSRPSVSPNQIQYSDAQGILEKSGSSDSSSDSSEPVTSQRIKRSPYPPGFVTWGWSESGPCICPPGMVYCRCYARSESAKNEAKASSSKVRRRVTRSKKSTKF